MLLAEALELVHGEPFTGAGRATPGSRPTPAHHRSGRRCRRGAGGGPSADDDWRGAEWAARQGLKVCPDEERLYRLLMRSAFASGSVPGVRRVFDELTYLLADPDDGVEPEDTIHPDTVALLERLTGPSRERHSA